MLKQCDDVEQRSVESNGVYGTQYTVHGTRYTVHCSPFTVHVHRTPYTYTIHRTPYIVLCDYFHLPVAPRPPMNLWR